MKFIRLVEGIKKVLNKIFFLKRKRKTLKIGKLKTPFWEIENFEMKSCDIMK